MKRIIITLAALALCVQARAQDNTLSTTDGISYTGITLKRIEPDGMYIEYTIPGGGIGMSKIKFERLSGAIRSQFGYSETAAHDYEASVAQANATVAQELNQRYEIERNARHQRESENERAYAGRMAEITRLNQAQAAAFYRNATIDWKQPGSFELSSGFTAGRSSTQTSYTPPALDLFPNRGVTIKSH